MPPAYKVYMGYIGGIWFLSFSVTVFVCVFVYVFVCVHVNIFSIKDSSRATGPKLLCKRIRPVDVLAPAWDIHDPLVILSSF